MLEVDPPWSRPLMLESTMSTGDIIETEKKAPAHFTEEEVAADSESQDLNYKKILRKIDRRILYLYSVVYLFTQINKGNLSNVAIVNLEAGHGIKEELSLNSQQWAWSLSSFYYSYLFFEPLATVLLKTFGPRVWQSRIMITWGAISMLQAAARNFSGLVAVRFFLGLAEAGFYTSVLYHLGFWVKPRELRQRVASFYSVGMLSGAVSGLLAYGISFLDQRANLSGWQWVFIFEGIPTVLLGIYTFFRLPNYVEDSNFLSEGEKKVLLDNLPKSAPTKADSSFSWDQVKELIRQPTFYTYCSIWFFQGVGGWGISFVLPTIVYELGFTGTATTQLMTMPPSFIGFILLNVLGYMLHRRYIEAFPTAMVMSLIQIVSYIVLLTVKSNVAKYVMLNVATAISNSLFPVLWPDRMRVVNGTSSSALAIGITNTACQFLGIVGPQIYQPKFGPTYRVSYACSIALCSCASASIALTWYLVAKGGLLHTEGAFREDSDDTDKS
ncbi:hypothetical protein CAAN3_05S00606 [[Candida] anglica]